MLIRKFPWIKFMVSVGTVWVDVDFPSLPVFPDDVQRIIFPVFHLPDIIESEYSYDYAIDLLYVHMNKNYPNESFHIWYWWWYEIEPKEQEIIITYE